MIFDSLNFEIDYKFLLKENNVVTLQQINLEDYSRAYYDGTYKIISKDDATIKINITAKFINSPDNLFININTTILEGRVLLTGLVDNQEIRIDAVRRVWEVEGVIEVINEIQIGDRSTLKEYANDVWITAQAKGKAATIVGLKVVGYNFETIKGKVYIAGITTKPEQLDELVESIKTIKGVKEIINYVIVK